MLTRLFAILMGLFFLTPSVQAVHIIITGGTALRYWENLRISQDRHDKWWANFVRASTIRISHIQQPNPKAKITWIVFKPAYVARAKEDGKPYTQWIQELAIKYKVKLVWTNTKEETIAAINKAGSKKDKVETLYYFGHSNAYAWLLDYSADIMGASTQWIHETDIPLIKPSIFTPNAQCWSYGCFTGNSMTYYWKQFLGVHLWGNAEKTDYAPVSNGQLPLGKGKWIK